MKAGIKASHIVRRSSSSGSDSEDSDVDSLEFGPDQELSTDAKDRQEVNQFRLLIIGKSGCGKTTILSKVCGEEVADKPSTTRGIHNIEREMEFKDNKLFIVHDSEGFEAGQDDEFKVVTNFIKSRSRRPNVNDRLHAIWYCLTTNSRPIQQSEEMFFGVKHDVPIVAIFTKFDLFVEEQLQELMEDADDDELDDEKEKELEQRAERVAKDKFEQHYSGALSKKPHPPEAIVALSDIHNSTPMDARLSELIRATTTALRVESKKGSKQEQTGANRLAALFAAAQKADLQEKYRWSIYYGIPEVLRAGGERDVASIFRPKLMKMWNINWTADHTPLLDTFKTHVEDHPKTFGNTAAKTERRRKKLTNAEQEAYRCLQLVSDLTVIVTEIFLLKIKDEAAMQEIVKKYPSTPAFPHIQENILELRLWKARDAKKSGLELFRFRNDLRLIIDGAVRLSLLEAK